MSAFVLLLVLLCDYYYFFYCLIIFLILIFWQTIRKRTLFFLAKEYFLSLFSFSLIVLASAGPLVFALLSFNRTDHFLGVHQPSTFSADLFSFLIHGAFWRFNALTQFFWKHLACYFGECSLHLGLTVIFVLVYTWIKRRKCGGVSLGLWFFILLFFFVLSLGPTVHIWGRQTHFTLMPYRILSIIFPPLRLSGVPARMSVMVFLSAAVIFALGFRLLAGSFKKRRWLLILFITMLFLEYFPAQMTTSRIRIPDYVETLKRQPEQKGILDITSGAVLSLYFQTIHEKPLVFGYVSRLPQSLFEDNKVIYLLFKRKDFMSLYHNFGIKYYLVPANLTIVSNHLSVNMLGGDEYAKLYELSDNQ